MLPITNQSRKSRVLLKRFMYSQFSLRNVFLILLGKVQPSISFTVLADPSSVYYNFEIKRDRLDAFIRYINLAPGLPVCPIKCFEEEEARFLLTLNVYKVTGIASGTRAEWSTYVRDASGKPRYMVLEARASAFSMDPVNVVTRRSRVEHLMGNGKIRTVVASDDEELFTATFPTNQDSPYGRVTGEWIEANDYIYWRNGICDEIFYNASLANPKARLISPASVHISDATHWARFLESEPVHVVQLEGALSFWIVPWANI